MSIVHCPRCAARVRVPAAADPQSWVRCTQCAAEYSLRDILNHEPPELEIITPPNTNPADAWGAGSIAVGALSGAVGAGLTRAPEPEDLELLAGGDSIKDGAWPSSLQTPDAGHSPLSPDDEPAWGEEDAATIVPESTSNAADDDLFGFSDEESATPITVPDRLPDGEDFSFDEDAPAEGGFGMLNDEAGIAGEKRIEVPAEEEAETGFGGFTLAGTNAAGAAVAAGAAGAALGIPAFTPRRRKKSSMLPMLIGTIFGGVLGLVIAYYGILMWVLEKDPIKLAPMLADYISPVMVPEALLPNKPVTRTPSTDMPSDPTDPSMDPTTPPTDPVTDPATPPADPLSPTDPVTPPADPLSPPTDPVSPPADPLTIPSDPADPGKSDPSMPKPPVDDPFNSTPKPVDPLDPAAPVTPPELPPVDPPKPADPLDPLTPPVVDPPKPVDPLDPAAPVTPPELPPVDPPKPTDPLDPLTPPAVDPSMPKPPVDDPFNSTPKPVDPPKPADPLDPLTPPVVDPAKPVDPLTPPVDDPFNSTPKPVDPPKPADPLDPLTPPVVDPPKPIDPPAVEAPAAPMSLKGAMLEGKEVDTALTAIKTSRGALAATPGDKKSQVQAYRDLSKLGEVLGELKAWGETVDEQKQRAEAVTATVGELQTDAATIRELSKLTPFWLQRPSNNGIIVVGKLDETVEAGKLYRMTVLIPGLKADDTPIKLVVYSAKQLESDSEGNVAFLGGVVKNPTERIPDYNENDPQVIWSSLPLTLK